MPFSRSSTPVLLAVATLASSALLGCHSSSSGQGGSALFVQEVLAPPAVALGQTCGFTNDPSQPSITSGVLDVGLRQEYDATYLLGSTYASSQLQAEAEYIQLGGAIVRVTDPSGNQLGTFTRLASASIPPPSGNVPGYAPVTATILDTATLQGAGIVQTLAAGGTVHLVTYVKFLGGTSAVGGTSGVAMQTDEFEFPVDVCDGCLLTFPPQDVDPSAPQPNCLAATASSAPALSPCMLGQDSQVECSQCLEIATCRGAVAADAGGE